MTRRWMKAFAVVPRSGCRLGMLLLLVLISLGCRPSGPRAAGSSNSAPENVRLTVEEIVRRGEILEKSDEFATKTQELAKGFSEIPISVPGEPLKWTMVKLNQVTGRFDGVRFRSPLSTPADMRWAFVIPTRIKVRWCILPMSGTMSETFTSFEMERNVCVEEIQYDIPPENATFLQPFDGGPIQPGQEYILWFFIEQGVPTPTHIAIRLAPEGSFGSSGRSTEIARDLGLPVPLRYNDVELLNRLRYAARGAGGRRNLDEHLRLTEEYIATYPYDREMLFWASSLNLDRGERALNSAEPEDPQPYYFAAAKYMRTLRSKCEELNEDEQAGFAEAIYFEAEAFAMAGDHDNAFASLKESLEAGYDPRLVDEQRFEKIIGPENLRSLLSAKKLELSAN